MEWFITDDGKYRIESLSATSMFGALEVIKYAFCPDEPVCIGSEVNENPIAVEELLELCADAALDGVSLVAVTTDTNKVVAASFNKLQISSSDTNEKPFFEIFAEERCTQESSRSLIQFMANVDARCNLFDKYEADCSLEIMFLATLKEYRQQKLAKILCQISLDLARKLKEGPVSKITLLDLGEKYSYMKKRSVTTRYPKICQAIWTSVGTQKIGKSLEFSVHVSVTYDEFEYNGKTYADRIGPISKFCELVAKKL